MDIEKLDNVDQIRLKINLNYKKLESINKMRKSKMKHHAHLFDQ